ncbi:MAG: hypothetical protein ACTSSE_13995 [Candidatus Thorarchaeota archaeon]
MELAIDEIMKSLSEKNQLFQNEAYFRIAFGRKIFHRHPDFYISMEYPVQELPLNASIDICIETRDGELVTAIELKYAPVKWSGTLDNIFYKFGERARDMTRFGFFSDISRLEKVVYNRPTTDGYVIFLTNDSHYWLERSMTSQTSKSLTDDREFNIHHGVRTKRRHSWHGDKEAKRKEPYLDFHGHYIMSWNDYSTVQMTKTRSFRYLVVRISK